MTNIDFYRKSYDILVTENQKFITKNEIDSLISGKTISYPKAMEDVFERMLISLQNYRGARNSIGYLPANNLQRNGNKIKKALYNLDIKKCLQFKNSGEIFQSFVSNSCDIKNSQKTWELYSKHIFNGIKYLSQFSNFQAFDNMVKSYINDPKQLPLKISENKDRIFGFALTCDWLKELGYLQYSKPDVHIMEIISNKLIKDYNFPYMSLRLSEEDYFDIITKIALDNSTSPYQVDKIIWLICSGDFHDPINKKGIKLKEEYLKRIKTW